MPGNPARTPSSIRRNARRTRGGRSPRGRGAPAASWITSRPTPGSIVRAWRWSGILVAERLLSGRVREDARFAFVVSNDAGCTGSKLARHLKGETIERINTVFPHWFCENYKHFNGHPEALPVDFHELIALSAPRPVYVSSASEDGDPEGEFLGALHASPVYTLYGFRGLDATEYPKPDTTFQMGSIGYHLRPGPHNLLEYDWTRFMDFSERHLEASRRASEGN